MASHTSTTCICHANCSRTVVSGTTLHPFQATVFVTLSFFFLQSNALGMTVLNRYGPTHFSQVNRYFSGTLYIPSVVAETSHRYTYENKRDRLVKVFRTLDELPKSQHMISTQSAYRLTSDSRQLDRLRVYRSSIRAKSSILGTEPDLGGMVASTYKPRSRGRN